MKNGRHNLLEKKISDTSGIDRSLYEDYLGQSDCVQKNQGKAFHTSGTALRISGGRPLQIRDAAIH